MASSRISSSLTSWASLGALGGGIVVAGIVFGLGSVVASCRRVVVVVVAVVVVIIRQQRMGRRQKL